jgi:glycosyltransferase 2 family protein
MRTKIATYLKYMLFLGAGLLLVWWQLYGMSAEEVNSFKAALKEANYLLVIPVVIMNLTSHLVRSMRWKLLLQPLDYNPSLANTFAVTMVGYLANAAVPRLGEVLKCSMLAKYENLKTEKLIGTIVTERIIDLITYGIFIGITILLQIDLIGNYVKTKLSAIGASTNNSIWLKLGFVLLVLALIFFVFKWIIKKYPQNIILQKTKTFTQGLIGGITSIKKLKAKNLFIFYTVIIWALYVTQLYIGFKAMESTAGLGFKAACAVLSLSTLAMIVTPNGIGSFPIFVMETLLIYGVATVQGTAYGWLIWGVSTVLIIVAGLVALIALPIINKNKNEIVTSHTKQNI